MTVGGIDLVPFGKKAVKEFGADDIGGLAAELSYRYFLALFPFFIFLAALGGFIANAISVEDPTTRLMSLLGDALPADAKSVMEGQVRSVVDSKSVGLLSFGIVGALWAASGAMKSLIKALNRAYDVPETRPFWKSTGLAILMTLASTIGILGSIVIVIATNAWGSDIADSVGAGSAFALTMRIAQWPLIIGLLLVAVALMYWLAPNLDVPFKLITPGAALFVVTWLVATLGFGLYVANFSSYNKTYGALGGVVVLLTWLYITNIVLLLGAEINALIDEEREPEKSRIRREAVASKASDSKQKQAMEPRAERSKRPVIVAARSDADHGEPELVERDGGGATTLVRTAILGAAIGLMAVMGRRARARAAPSQ